MIKRLYWFTWFFFLLTSTCLHREALAESPAAGSVSIDILREHLPALEQPGTRVVIALIDDSEQILEQIASLQNASKPQLEPIIKQYMRSAERLTQLARAHSDNDERQRLITDMKALEAQKDAILAVYRPQIRELLASHTQKHFETAATSLPAQLEAISPGRYRAYVTLTVKTTQFHWFEPFQLQGGDRLAIQLTRDNVKNPDWTDLNWWSFMNLDFSKHHQIPSR